MQYKVYYSHLCPDTEVFMDELNHLEIDYQAVNITESMKNLKEFLAIRDFQSAFIIKKELGQVGVPVLMLDESNFIFDYQSLKQIETDLKDDKD